VEAMYKRFDGGHPVRWHREILGYQTHLQSRVCDKQDNLGEWQRVGVAVISSQEVFGGRCWQMLTCASPAHLPLAVASK
jgi:hypothetical protein